MGQLGIHGVHASPGVPQSSPIGPSRSVPWPPDAAPFSKSGGNGNWHLTSISPPWEHSASVSPPSRCLSRGPGAGASTNAGSNTKTSQGPPSMAQAGFVGSAAALPGHSAGRAIPNLSHLVIPHLFCSTGGSRPLTAGVPPLSTASLHTR